MDMNLARSIMTIVLFSVFIAIVIWAWSRKRKAAFDAAARLPFDDETGLEAPREDQESGSVR